MHFRSRRFAALVCLAAAQPAFAGNFPPGDLLCGPFGPGGTWNLYQTSAEPLTWAKARELAAAAKDPRGGTDKMGHLVTIGSAAENMFVRQYAAGQFLWIGLTDNEKFGGREAGNDRRDGWRWVTGEPLGNFAPWCGSEPSSGPGFPEDAVAITASGLWVDWGIGEGGEAEIKQSFVIEWDTQLPV